MGNPILAAPGLSPSGTGGTLIGSGGGRDTALSATSLPGPRCPDPLGKRGWDRWGTRGLTAQLCLSNHEEVRD